MTSIIEALISHLPEVITLNDGTEVPAYWHPSGIKVPESKAETNPVIGIISIVGGGTRGRSRNQGQPEEILYEQVDTITFNAGTLGYDVTEKHIDSVTSITGTAAFTEDVDYTFNEGQIVWVSGATNPDDGSSFVVTYQHKRYQVYADMWTNRVARIMIRAKDWEGGGRKWPNSILAETVGRRVEDFVRAETGKPVPFVSGGSDGLMLDKLLRISPMQSDPAFSVSVWTIDVRVKECSRHKVGLPTNAYLEADVTGDTL